MRTARDIFFVMAVVLCWACNAGQKSPVAAVASDTAFVTGSRLLFEQASAALDSDSVYRGERLLREAIEMAEAEGDLHTRYLAELRLAESLVWGNTEAGLAMAKQALRTFDRHPDDQRNHVIILDYIGTYASQLAYNNDAPFDEALDYTRRAHALAEAIRDTELQSQTLTSLANILWATQDYPAALRCAREAVELAPPSLLLGAQQVLARCLVNADSLEAAAEVYRSMEPGDDVQAHYIIQSSLAKIALRQHDLTAAEAAIDSAFVHAEDLYFSALQHKDDYYQAALQQETENQRLRYDAALQRRTLWAAVALFLLVGVIVLLVARSRQDEYRRRRQEEERLHQQELEDQMRQTQQQQQEAERLAQQLRMQDATVDFLKDFILQRSAVIRKLDASSERHITLLQREWTEIEHTLDAIDNDRFARMRQRFPELKEEDLQLCILTRLRLTNRAIGNIYGISISAVQHRKLRIKKEIFHEEDPDIPFEQVLKTL